MGRDKALCRLGGETFWERQWRLLEQAGAAERFVCGPRRREFGAEVECLPDVVEGVGPLGGIVAALRRATTPWVLILAVDLPLVTLADLRALLAHPDRGCVPLLQSEARRLYEPLAALYPAALAKTAWARLQAGEESAQPLLRAAVQARYIVEWPLDTEAVRRFRSLNDPQELAEAERALTGRC